METATVQRALETYDHLLWEAIIKTCGMALSKAFEQQENWVRVVYQTYDSDFPGIGSIVDPREEFSRIKSVVARSVSLALPLRKLGRKCRGYNATQALCSHDCYRHFLLETLSESAKIDILCQGSLDYPTYCDFVEIGRKEEEGYICCPCTGKHLANARNLENFVFDLSAPKRVGRDTYEFRFRVVG